MLILIIQVISAIIYYCAVVFHLYSLSGLTVNFFIWFPKMPPYVPSTQTSTVVECKTLEGSESTKGNETTIATPSVANAVVTAKNKNVIQYELTPFETYFGFKTPLIWLNLIAISLYHIVAVAGFLYLWKGGHPLTIVFGFFIGGCAGFGVTAGVHRLWCHRAYKARVPLRVILAICYSVAGQNTIFDWVRDHRVHHKFSETDADPHNANRGFFFSHVGWLMMKKHPDVIKKGNSIDMSDILNDPVVQFHEKYFSLLKAIFCFILPTIIPVYCWNETWANSIATQPLLRYILSLNFTWLVNSLAHMSGTKPYDKRIKPVENKSVALLAMGEGWHNYHHAFPWDYKAAELGDYSLNVTTFWIDLFSKIGWAYDLKQPSKHLVKKVVEATGDGSHPVFGHHEISEDQVRNIEKELEEFDKKDL